MHMGKNGPETVFFPSSSGVWHYRRRHTQEDGGEAPSTKISYRLAMKGSKSMVVPEYVYGSIAPTFTAFKDDGSLDDDGQRHFLDFMLENGGVSAFFIRSGMGQMYTFGVEDTKQIARTACNHLRGKAPVLVGCSGVWDRNYDNRPEPHAYVEQGRELGKYAEELGADGVVYTIPEALALANDQTMSELIEDYFHTMCSAVSIPVLFYQPPGTREEYRLTPEILAQIAGIKNLVGGKVSSVDCYYLFRLIRAVRHKQFGFIVGAETAFYAGLLAGARACIGQGATVNPRIIRAIADRFLAGNLDGAVEAQEDANILVEECPNAIDFMKMYATEHGHPVGLHTRSMGSNPYMNDRMLITREEYEAFKHRYEAIVGKYT